MNNMRRIKNTRILHLKNISGMEYVSNHDIELMILSRTYMGSLFLKKPSKTLK